MLIELGVLAVAESCRSSLDVNTSTTIAVALVLRTSWKPRAFQPRFLHGRHPDSTTPV